MQTNRNAGHYLLKNHADIFHITVWQKNPIYYQSILVIEYFVQILKFLIFKTFWLPCDVNNQLCFLNLAFTFTFSLCAGLFWNFLDIVHTCNFITCMNNGGISSINTIVWYSSSSTHFPVWISEQEADFGMVTK